jgi:RNA polymerase sigma-70 factor (ECF subfamily)
VITEKELVYNELLVLRVRRGDRSALEEMVRHWGNRLFYYIRRLLDNDEDAWDAHQETWLKVVRNIGSLKEPRVFPMWLYRIARNTAISHLRGRYADRAAIDDSELSDVEADSNSFTFEDAEQVHYALGRISLPHREVLTLFFLEDLSLDEIAAVLDVPVGTVKSRLHFAKRALRSIIEQEESQ